MSTVVNVRMHNEQRQFSIVVPKSYSELTQKLCKQFNLPNSNKMQISRVLDGSIVQPDQPLNFVRKELLEIEIIDPNGAAKATTSSRSARPPSPSSTSLFVSSAMRSVVATGNQPIMSGISIDFIDTNAHNLKDPLICQIDRCVAADQNEDKQGIKAASDEEDKEISESDEEDEDAVISLFDDSISSLHSFSTSSHGHENQQLPCASLHYLQLQPWLNANSKMARLQLEQLAEQLRVVFQGPFQVKFPTSSSSNKEPILKLHNDLGFELHLHRYLADLMVKSSSLLSPPSFTSSAASLPSIHSLQSSMILIVLCHGGYFAAAACCNGRTVAHKTFHRYVVRRKQGGRQVAKDASSGGRFHSVGSAMRRHHELRLRQQIRELFGSWRELIRTQADLIVVHAPGAVNREVVFGELGAFGTNNPSSANECSAAWGSSHDSEPHGMDSQFTRSSGQISASTSSSSVVIDCPRDDEMGSGEHLNLSRTYRLRQLESTSSLATAAPSSSGASSAKSASSSSSSSSASSSSSTSNHLLGLQCVLDPADARVRNCPFGVGRASLAEALSVYRQLNTVYWTSSSSASSTFPSPSSASFSSST